MALVKQIGFTRFSRWGENLGRLHVTEATHTEALDGTDEVKLTCADELVKGDRIVWADRQGKVHEHIADQVARVHSQDGATATTATCINSVAELWDDYIEDRRPSGSVAVALASILADTRWEAGPCDVQGAASKTFYHVSVREALSDLLDVWGGELETEVETDGAKVTRRIVRVRALRGDQESPKRFTWTKDLLSVTRTVGSDNPKTRVYGYGKGVETEGGGYGRRLTFGSVNGGLDYVEDADATQVWGHPDGKGGILPAVDVYVDEDCEDAAALLQETRDYLERVKAPTVSYEASVLDLYAFGRTWEGVSLGDRVAIVDKGFGDDGIRLQGRVSKLKRDLITAETEATFGNLTDAMADMWASVAQALKSGSNARAGYDAVAGTSVGWLTQLQAALNKQFNAVGTYKVESFGLGSVYSNVPLNPDTGTPVKSVAGMWAVNINGMGIRLASSLNAQGEWDWKTFITGDAVTADCINTGTMRADRIRAGLLTDEAGKNFWDLTSGEFSLSAGATVGGESIATADAAIKSVDVEYALGDSQATAPTMGWQTTAPAWEAGRYMWQRTKVTSGAGAVSYSAPTCIQGAAGKDGAPGEAGADGKDGTPGKDGKDAQPVYFHRAYATSADGKEGFTTTWAAGCRYFGTYVDNTMADSDDPTKYDWTLFVGKDGADGVAGKDGANGTTYYLHIAYATSADGTQGFSVDDPAGKTYIGQCVDTAKDDPTTPASYTWALFVGKDGAPGEAGADGKDGTPGKDGKDSQPVYFHRAYATSADGKEGFTTTWAAGCRYFGTYVDNTMEDSDDPTKYDWTLFVGKDGADGVAGKDGANGTTYYLHIAYATSADGSQGFSVDDPADKTYIGQCVDTERADPTTPASYTWALIKGADGANGTGISAIQEQYYLSTSNTAQAGGAWSSSQPAWVKGRYYWTRSKVTWSDGTVTYTTPQLARALTSSNQGVSDLDGKLTQKEIFNRLTNGGKTQGIYLKNGLVYINGEYIKAGTVVTDRIVSSEKVPGGNATYELLMESHNWGNIGATKTYYGGDLKVLSGTDGAQVMEFSSSGGNAELSLKPMNYEDAKETGLSTLKLHGRQPNYRYFVRIRPLIGNDCQVTLYAALLYSANGTTGYNQSGPEIALCKFPSINL